MQNEVAQKNLVRLGLAAVAITLSFGVSAARAQVMTNAERLASSGDQDATITASANLSSKLRKKDVATAIKIVGDWQLNRAETKFNQDWTYAALYAGMMAVPADVSGTKYKDALFALGKRTNWMMGPNTENANDQAIGRTYAILYEKYKDPNMIASFKERTEHFMQHVDNPDKLLWHWCDALFMGPPAFTEIYKIEHNKAYLDFMDHEWWLASNEMYDPETHLYFRDKSFIPKREANGKHLFWARGNGWVLGALAQVLTDMPKDYPSRPKYVAQFKEMAEAIANLQQPDGLWRAGLLDQAAYPLPEVSGSGFNVYGIAWGIHSGLLDRKKYMPVVEKGWAGLVSHVYADGRLGCIQPIGSAPAAYTPTSSYVYGVGAYLLAGSEVFYLASK